MVSYTGREKGKEGHTLIPTHSQEIWVMRWQKCGWVLNVMFWLTTFTRTELGPPNQKGQRGCVEHLIRYASCTVGVSSMCNLPSPLEKPTWWTWLIPSQCIYDLYMQHVWCVPTWMEGKPNHLNLPILVMHASCLLPLHLLEIFLLQDTNVQFQYPSST